MANIKTPDGTVDLRNTTLAEFRGEGRIATELAGPDHLGRALTEFRGEGRIVAELAGPDHLGRALKEEFGIVR